jgi:predicted N-acetyltransferase YhbS
LDNLKEISISFLAPLSVIPKYQKQGVGSKLIKKGLELLSKSGIDIVFVVGHIKYYPKHGLWDISRLVFEDYDVSSFANVLFLGVDLR